MYDYGGCPDPNDFDSVKMFSFYIIQVNSDSLAFSMGSSLELPTGELLDNIGGCFRVNTNNYYSGNGINFKIVKDSLYINWDYSIHQTNFDPAYCSGYFHGKIIR